MKYISTIRIFVVLAVFGSYLCFADPTHNPPLVCGVNLQCDACSKVDGPGAGCVFLTLDLGQTTPWSGEKPVSLRIHSSEASVSLFSPSQLKTVFGYSFKNVMDAMSESGAFETVVFVGPKGDELRFHFHDGDSVGVPEPNNLGKSLARVRMVDAEGWATTSAPAFYDLYPGDGSVWRFLAAGATNERGALVSYADPRGRVLTMDDFGVDIVRDALGNIRQVKTLTRLADVQTLSPTHYAVTVYPLTEEPEQVADTGLYALPEHAPTRVLDVAQGESVKELLVGFQKGTGDMRQYRYVAVNGDWTLYQPSGLVEAQELYFTEDESGAQRLHTIRDETGKLWSRDEYNYVSAYWGYLITNRIEGIPGDATRTTSWSYYTDGPHKDLLRETVEPTGNRILYEYDAQNRVIRESMPLVEEETLYSYEPVDPSDPPLLCDTRPRCVVRKMQGIEIQRTYYVYGTNGVDVVERVGEQGAAYGGTNVLRTVTTYYPVTNSAVDGLVRSFRHENGIVDSYEYRRQNGFWTEFITHLHESWLSPIPMHTTRHVHVRDSLGRMVENATELMTGVDVWVPVAREQYYYDSEGNRIKTENLAGQISRNEWGGNCCGKTSSTSWDGITTMFAYDDEGRVCVESRFQPDPVEKHFEHDRLGRLVATFMTNRTASIGTPERRMHFDSLSRKVAEQDENGNWTRFDYSPDGRSRTTTTPTGLTSITTTDFTGRVVSEAGSLHPPKTVEYGVETNGVRWIKTNEGSTGGKQTIVWRNMLDQMIDRAETGVTGELLHTRTAYDRFGNIFSVIDETGIVEIHTRNELTGEVRIRESVGSEWRERMENSSYQIRNGAVWNVVTGVVSCSDPGIAPQVHFAERLLSGFDPGVTAVERLQNLQGGIETKTTRFDSDRSEVRSETALSGVGTPSVQLFKWGRKTEEFFSSGATNQFEYDGLGRLAQERRGSNVVTSYRYDAAGRLAEKSTGDRNVLVFGYDEFGRNTVVSNSTGLVQQRKFNPKGEVVEQRGTDAPVSYSYDEFGRVVSLRRLDRDETETTWAFDPATGLLLSKTYPDGTRTRYVYDRFGREIAFTNARGATRTYSRDGWGNVISAQYDDGTAPVQLQFDGLGRLSSAVAGERRTEFAYDERGSVTSELVRAVSNILLERHYDEFGRYVGLSIDGIRESVIEHDPETGNVLTLNESFRWEYEPGTGRKQSLVYPDGRKVEWRYDDDWGSLAVVSNDVFSVETRTYDDSGLCTSRNADRFLYNGKRELVGANLEDGKNFAYSFDDGGNFVLISNDVQSLVCENNELDQMMFVGGFRNEYDLDGNQTRFLSNGTGWTAVYDFENRPVSMASDDGIVLNFSYDWLGRRTSKTVRGNGRIVSDQRFVYDAFKCVAVVDAVSNRIARTFVWDPTETTLTRPLVATLADENVVAYYFVDASKNVAFLVPNGGTPEDGVRYSYDPFGKITATVGTNSLAQTLAMVNPFGFSSEHSDSETGLVYYNFRYYNPTFGNWLSRDPLFEMSDVNLYRFCRGDPIDGFDILGLAGCNEQSGSISTPFTLDVGIGKFSVVYTKEYAIKRCPIKCEDCSDGWETTTQSGSYGGSAGEWTVQLYGVPIDIGFNWSIGSSSWEQFNTCTGFRNSKKCNKFSVSLYGQTGVEFGRVFSLKVGISATIQNEGCDGDADKWTSNGYIYVTECWWWACYTKNLLRLW
jgi:RHS repeat-associated protein